MRLWVYLGWRRHSVMKIKQKVKYRKNTLQMENRKQRGQILCSSSATGEKLVMRKTRSVQWQIVCVCFLSAFDLCVWIAVTNHGLSSISPVWRQMDLRLSYLWGSSFMKHDVHTKHFFFNSQLLSVVYRKQQEATTRHSKCGFFLWHQQMSNYVFLITIKETVGYMFLCSLLWMRGMLSRGITYNL